ncbi:MAG TPA: WG repeat-containing protein [Fulvivirga sp.]|nr:WG repeat-containing protein [Fulvivirga sp.]
MRSVIFLILFFTLYHPSQAQTGLVKKALKMQVKGKIEKAEKYVNKALEKDSALSAALYAKAVLLFDTAYDKYNLDQAYNTVLLSRSTYSGLDEKNKGKHLKIGINLLTINDLKSSIDSAAFSRAVKENTEQRFIYFIETFSSAAQLERAKQLRDSLAFITARKENTYQGYENFMEKYPEALQIDEAKRRYERLYFQKSTADGKMESYVRFLKLQPTTPYRDEAEKNIFEIATAENTVESYEKFLSNYPKSTQLKRARAYLYHIYKSSGTVIDFPTRWRTDSLAQVMDLDKKGPLILISKFKKYGFMDFGGAEIIPPKFDKIDADLLCNPLKEDVFSTDIGLISRNGTVVFRGKYDQAEDMGFGMMRIVTGKSTIIYHKSGRQIGKRYQDVKLLGGKFLAYKTDGKWGLMTFTGRIISKPIFDNISTQGPFYIFEDNEHYEVLNSKVLAESVNQNPINFQALFTDVELLDEGHLWLQSSFGETIFDEKLNEVVPYNQQHITSLANGYLIHGRNDFTVTNGQFKPILSNEAEKVKYNDSFICFKKTGWSLFNLKDLRPLGKFDSLAVYGKSFAIGVSTDSVKVFFEGGRVMISNDIVNIRFLATSGSSQYLALKFSKSKEVQYFDSNGIKVLVGEFDDVTPLGAEYLVVTKKGKKGLFDKSGKQLLPMKYDAVANYSSGYVSTLLNKKFGLVNMDKHININADYDKNIQPYNESLLIATVGDKSGFLDLTGKTRSNFDFEEIRFWNDSTALVKQNYLWHFYDIYHNEIKGMGIKSLQILLDTKEEKIATVLIDNGYGVYSSKRGEIIAPTFNDIINIGTGDNMVFFTEKHVEEAEFYVVIYYNHYGEIIRKQAFEALDYMLIYCDQ